MVGGLLAFALSARWAALITEVFVYFVPAALLIRYTELRRAKVFDIRGKINGRLAVLIVIVGAAYLASTAMFVELAHFIEPIPELYLKSMYDLLVAETSYEFVAVVFVVAVVPAVAEELLFRGFVQPVFIGRFGPTSGIIVTALLFAIFHLNPWTFFPLLIVGTLFGYLAYKTGTFWAGAFAHFGYNVPAIVEANRIGTMDYEAVTEGIPWYVSAMAITAAAAGTVLLRNTLQARDGVQDEEEKEA